MKKNKKDHDGKGDNHSRHGSIKTVTLAGMGVNVMLSILKFVGGIVGMSQAVIADAVHSLSDISTDLAILVGVRYWDKPADKAHPHGHKRIETMVTLGIGIALFIVGMGILIKAIETLRMEHTHTPGSIALIATIVSIFTKELLYQWTVAAGNRIKSAPLVANAWHHRSDALSSIPAMLAVLGAMINPNLTFLDQIGAVFVTLFIFQAAYKISRPAFDLLIDKGAPEEHLNEISRIARETDGVESIHNVRTRYIGNTGLAVDLHIQVDKNMTVHDGHEISGKVKQRLIEEGPEVIDVIVHLEPFDEG
jgi:cation diffusion facilitator family transporter